MTTGAIIQPSFLPWSGYFSIIKRCEKFVFFDDVQYDKRGWRNRNQIKTKDGSQWITVPVEAKGKYHQLISVTKIDSASGNWQRKILGSLQASYGRAAYFDQYFPMVSEILSHPWEHISDLDIALTKQLCEWLQIETDFYLSSELHVPSDLRKTQRLIAILQKLRIDHYISGPTAKEYIGEGNDFREAGITLEYMNYAPKPYPQFYGPFNPYVTCLDLLFHTGPEAKDYV
jgi:hypothetical protein